MINILACLPWLQAKELYFRKINIENETSSSSAISICQDGKGLIWFGNEHLNRYDGQQVQSYSLSRYLPHIKDSYIHALCGGQDSLLFFLADQSLIQLNVYTETFTDLQEQARDLFYHDGQLYFITDKALLQYRAYAEPMLITRLPEESDEKMTTLYKTDRQFLIGTSRGCYSLEGGQRHQLLDGMAITTLFCDRQGRFWCGGAKGLYVCQQEEWIHFEQGSDTHPLAGDYIQCINQDELGFIWVGTYTGISVIDPTLKKSTSVAGQQGSAWSLRNSSVHALYKDVQGGMWIGTYFGGISYYNPNLEKIKYYGSSGNLSEGLSGFLFSNMTEDASGHLYIAAEHGGVNVMDRRTGKIEPLFEEESQPSKLTVKDLWYDTARGCLYLATHREGLLCYQPGKGLHPIGREVLTSSGQQIVSQLLPYGQSLLVTTQGGLFELDLERQQLSRFWIDPTINDQIDGIILAAHLDHQQARLWLSLADQGVICIDLVKSQIVPNPKEMDELLAATTVHYITEGKEGAILFLTRDAGACLYDARRQQWRQFNQANGTVLSDQLLRALLLPSGGFLITSPHGFSMVDADRMQSTHLMLGTLLPLTQINYNCGVYASPYDSTLFIGGVGGFLSFKEQELSVEKKEYDLVWSSVSINNKPYSSLEAAPQQRRAVPYLDRLELSHQQNNITCSFSSTNYRYPQKQMYRYRLLGLDNQWIETRLHQVTYTALRPGDYELVVCEAATGKELHLPLTIRAPFYASVYAYLLYTLLAIAIACWLYRFNRSRQQLKASLQQEREEKLQVEKLNQMKLNFYMGISHEIRTPLTLITAQLDWLLSNYELTHTLRNRLLKLKQHTLLLQQLVTEILDFRRLEQGKMPLRVRRINLYEWINDYTSQFIPYARIKGIRFSVEIPDGSLWMWADPMLLQKVLNNLIFNAFKFTPKEGSIQVMIHQEGGKAILRVADSGIGMTPEQQKHVFECFYQAADQSQTGSGIGLALTYEIIQLHKGTISVKSEVGKGTTFTIALLLGEGHFTEEEMSKEEEPDEGLPVTVSTADPKANAEQQSQPATPSQPYSVLLVEDNEELLELMKEAFSWMYQTYTAKDGQEGLDRAIETVPDLIISDVMMPRLSGIEMAQQLKKRLDTAHIPVILLTALSDKEKIMEGLRSGVTDYIVKPFQMELLLQKCNNLLCTLHSQQEYFRKNAQLAVTDLATNQLDKQLLDDSVRIIEQNLENKEFSIDMWCKEIAVGRTRLGMKIKGITGQTLNEFMLQIKLRKATELLKEGQLTVNEVAWKSGFSSAGYFGKCFKEQFGVTPGQYKEQ